MQTTLKLGHIEFLNSLPLMLNQTELAKHLPDFLVQMQSAPPASLNEAMLRGELDISPVSSAFYLQNQHQFVLLDQPCIASSQKVKSVLLFIPKNHSQTLALPNTSETSIALTHWYLSTHQINWTQKHYYKPNQALKNIEQNHITLTIGDEALLVDLALESKKERYQIIDLAEAWVSHSGLPCVFAVWIAQRKFAHENPQALIQLSQAFTQKITQLIQDKTHQQLLLEQAKTLYPKQFEALNEPIEIVEKKILNYWLDCLRYTVSDEITGSLTQMEKQVLPHAQSNQYSNLNA